MLIVTMHNDGTGDEEIGNYDCEVLITLTPTKLLKIAHARVNGHDRRKGWRFLVRQVLRNAIDE